MTNRLARIVAGTMAAAIIYYVLHDCFGGPFMFVTTDPPAADPSRDLHVALSWMVIYGVSGFVGGAVGVAGNCGIKVLPFSLLPVSALVLLRSGGSLPFFLTEEGRYGILSAMAFALAGGCVKVLVAGCKDRGHCGPSEQKAAHSK